MDINDIESWLRNDASLDEIKKTIRIAKMSLKNINTRGEK